MRQVETGHRSKPARDVNRHSLNALSGSQVGRRRIGAGAVITDDVVLTPDHYSPTLPCIMPPSAKIVVAVT